MNQGFAVHIFIIVVKRDENLSKIYRLIADIVLTCKEVVPSSNGRLKGCSACTKLRGISDGSENVMSVHFHFCVVFHFC